MTASYQNINDYIYKERSNTSIYVFPTFSDNNSMENNDLWLNNKG